MKNYEDDENQQGLELWHSLYTQDGLKSTWKATYTDWLNELADSMEVPTGIFRDYWIQDCIIEGERIDLEVIDRWFKPTYDDESDNESDDSSVIVHPEPEPAPMPEHLDDVIEVDNPESHHENDDPEPTE